MTTRAPASSNTRISEPRTTPTGTRRKVPSHIVASETQETAHPTLAPCPPESRPRILPPPPPPPPDTYPPCLLTCNARISSTSSGTGPSTSTPGTTSWIGIGRTGDGGTPSSRSHSVSCADDAT